MAFALTKAAFYGSQLSDTVKKRGLQHAALYITGANTDIAYDLSNASGTFWTAAKAHATYGTIASTASDALTAVAAASDSLVNVAGSHEPSYVRALSATPTTLIAYTSAAATGNALSEALTVTGILSTDTVLAVTAADAGANTTYSTLKFDSAAYGGGSATPTLTVTGLLATDSIVAVTQKTANANSLPLLGWSNAANDAIDVKYSANPGANGVVTVSVRRATGKIPIVDWSTLANNALTVFWSEIPGAGAKVEVLVSRTTGATLAANQYYQAVTSKIPALTFLTGSAPTATTLLLTWDLADGAVPVTNDIG